MPAPYGTNCDLRIVQKKIGYLIRFLDRNAMAGAKTVSTSILADITALDTAIQAATDNVDLSASATLPLRYDINPDPGIADIGGTNGMGVNTTTLTGS